MNVQATTLVWFLLFLNMCVAQVPVVCHVALSVQAFGYYSFPAIFLLLMHTGLAHSDTVDRQTGVFSRAHFRTSSTSRSCGLLAKAQATARVDVPTALAGV